MPYLKGGLFEWAYLKGAYLRGLINILQFQDEAK